MARKRIKEASKINIPKGIDNFVKGSASDLQTFINTCKKIGRIEVAENGFKEFTGKSPYNPTHAFDHEDNKEWMRSGKSTNKIMLIRFNVFGDDKRGNLAYDGEFTVWVDTRKKPMKLMVDIEGDYQNESKEVSKIKNNIRYIKEMIKFEDEEFDDPRW